VILMAPNLGTAEPFDRRVKLEFHGSKITSDGGLLTYRELDDALGLTEIAGSISQDSRTGKNGWHGMSPSNWPKLACQEVCSRKYWG
jgi:hypothetical protein